MMRIRCGKWSRLVAAVATAVAAGAMFSATALAFHNEVATSRSTPNTDVFDPKAAQELAAALHHMHEIWSSGDIGKLKMLVVGDDSLVTFELHPRTHKAIRLASKSDMDAFIEEVFQMAATDKAEIKLENPMIKCRGTSSFGVCTEECTVRVSMPDGVEELHQLMSTAVAVKEPDGWKWIQWHMSDGAPRQVYKDGRLIGNK